MNIEPGWSLDAARVEVWSLVLDEADEDASLLGVLDAAEQEQAARMRAGAVRKHFIKARAALRCLLARYLGVLPSELALHLNAFGKPRLDGSALRFNLSHTRGLALYAMTCGREVGVDVEWIDAAVDWRPVAPTVFTPDEIAALASRSDFFTAWARKEALLKGLGTGFGAPEAPSSAEGWTVRDLDVGSDCKAALAVHGSAAFQIVQRSLDADLLFRLQQP
ncbi:MAG TPA: 4'-phosphopantetheinyl transferase superfamily protein [Burkholderiaceae bacterium]|jgi:4'-phosphopantetheinyl transferase